MRLYHGSLVAIEKPKILKPSRPLDYGSGFYTTTSFEQAEQWVHRKLSDKQPLGFVNVYEFQESALDLVDSLTFKQADEEWVDFVMQNRLNPDFRHNYDIVYGPVANDTVYAQFSLFEGGLISKSTLIEELKAYKLIDQMLFHTEKALAFLTFVKAEEIKR
ncbi:MAG: DUF3990 domain-containing protein [Bacteroidales bacterium]|nr:DUF3990 domain-containing protein [Bacteroidales bacterium]